MSTEKSPAKWPEPAGPHVERKALQPVAAAPLLPGADAPGGWPAEEHLPDEKDDNEC